MKAHLKQAARITCRVLTFPLFLVFLGLARVSGPETPFASFSQFFSLFPGIVGNYLRLAWYQWTLIRCEDDVFVCFGTLLSQPETVLESGAYIGPQCNIGMCRIGRNTLLGSGVHVLSGKRQHDFSDPNLPIKDQARQFDRIEIGEDCWIGNGTIVMANVGAGCVVGAGSVVTKDLPERSIAVGNPARIVGKR